MIPVSRCPGPGGCPSPLWNPLLREEEVVWPPPRPSWPPPSPWPPKKNKNMNNKVQKCKNLFVCSKTEQIRLKNSDKKIEINLAFSSLNCGLNFSEISRQKYLFSKFCLRSREDFKRYLAWIQSSRSHEHLIF